MQEGNKRAFVLSKSLLVSGRLTSYCPKQVTGGGEIDVISCWEKLQRIMATFAILQMVRNRRDELKRNEEIKVTPNCHIYFHS